MSTRIREGRYVEVAGYALEVLEELAAGRAYPSEVNTEEVRKWAQHTLDRMVAHGFIEPQGGQS